MMFADVCDDNGNAYPAFSVNKFHFHISLIYENEMNISMMISLCSWSYH